MKRILITGAAGQIGKALAPRPARLLSAHSPARRCAAWRRRKQRGSSSGRHPRHAALEKATAGIDCVVHLAGQSTEAAWEKVLPLNIEGCYNVFEAARRSGVKRIVFASSNHAIGFHRRERFIDNTVLPRPDTRYGVSKVFGEALGRLYADKYGMSVACLRIGTFSYAGPAERRAPAADLDQSSRHGAARAPLHRLPGLSFHCRLRRVQQSAQPLGQHQCQIPRLSPRGRFGKVRRGDFRARQKRKRDCGAVSRRLLHARWNLPAIRQRSMGLGRNSAEDRNCLGRR